MCAGVLATRDWPPAQKTRQLKCGTPPTGNGESCGRGVESLLMCNA